MNPKTKYSRRRVINAIIDMLAMGTPAKQVAKTLAAYLVETKQTRDVELYLKDIESETSRRLGTATVHVSSARELSQATHRRIKQLITDSSGAKNVEIIETIDPNLIGGIVATTADSELNGSVRAKLQQLRSI
jgi:F0F1-type ATP synthase delta subunit